MNFQRRGQLKFLEGRVVQFVYIKLESFQISFKEQCSEYVNSWYQTALPSLPIRLFHLQA